MNLKGTNIVVKDDRSLCMHAGFCGNRSTNIWKMIKETGNSEVRAKVIAMVEKCPSGALSFAFETEGEPLEPALSQRAESSQRDRNRSRRADLDYRWHPVRAVRLAAPGDPQQSYPVPLWGLGKKTSLRRQPYWFLGHIIAEEPTRRDDKSPSISERGNAMSTTDLLQGVWLFSGLDQAQLDAISRFTFRKAFGPGELIAEEDSQPL